MALTPLFFAVIVFVLAGCQKPINYDELPETEYSDTPVMGA